MPLNTITNCSHISRLSHGSPTKPVSPRGNSTLTRVCVLPLLSPPTHTHPGSHPRSQRQHVTSPTWPKGSYYQLPGTHTTHLFSFSLEKKKRTVFFRRRWYCADEGVALMNLNYGLMIPVPQHRRRAKSSFTRFNDKDVTVQKKEGSVCRAG